MTSLIIGTLGALMVTFAFWKNVRGDWDVLDADYLFWTGIGSLILMCVALCTAQWHFAALNALWTYVSLSRLLRLT